MKRRLILKMAALAPLAALFIKVEAKEKPYNPDGISLCVNGEFIKPIGSKFRFQRAMFNGKEFFIEGSNSADFTKRDLGTKK